MTAHPNDLPNSRSVAARRLLTFFGSLKLAMILLGVIIVACIVGTVAESRFDTAVAQAYVYDAPWFMTWLVLLCVNLVGAALVRYPWKPHQIGFVMTHAGIVVLLVGAMVGRIWGIEGSLTLFKGAEPATRLVLNQTSLEVLATGSGEAKSRQLDLTWHPPSAKRPVRLAINGVRITALDYTKTLGVRTRVDSSATDGAPAVHVVLRSSMVPQPFDYWLLLGDRQRGSVAFGPATIRLVSDTKPSGADKTVRETQAKSSDPSVASASPTLSRERHFVFAKFPEMTMTRALSGPPTGLKAKYKFDPADSKSTAGKGMLEFESSGQQFEVSVASLLEGPVPVPGTTWTVKGLKYLADFRIEGQEPISASDEPKNPAVVFEIVGAPPSTATEECNHADGECDHTQKRECCPETGAAATPGAHPATGDGLTLFCAADGSLRYETVTKGKSAAKGTIELGREYPTGMADWKFQVRSFLPSATVRDELAPLPADAEHSTGASGLLIRAEKAGQTSQQWIAYGAPAHLRVGDEAVHLTFGNRVQPLDFGVVLDRFEVERDEGTQTPAGFKSHVRFVDLKNPSKSVAREVWMNHPANYPDFPGVGLFGTAYKFSQASWNPNDLNQTTLQVLRDPGWSLKWSGSFLLCAGIFTMFYLKPYPRRHLLKKS